MSFDFSPIFKGIATALITPFRNGGVDYVALGAIIDRQVASGVSALVLCGTTGEASTLSGREQAEVIKFSTERVAGKIPIIAVCGYGVACRRNIAGGDECRQ